MFCKNCGKELIGTPDICINCGAVLNPGTTQGLLVTTETRTSGFAVTSLVLGLVSLFIPFLGILSIIFGAVSMNQIKKSPNIQGKGMAIAGLVLGIITISWWIIYFVFLASLFLSWV